MYYLYWANYESFKNNSNEIRLAFAGLVFAVAGIAQYAASKPWLAVLSAVLSAALALFGVLELLPLIRLQKSIRRLAGKDA